MRKILSWIIALGGLWEFGDILALVTPGFGEIQAFMWNHILVGLILMFVGAWTALTNKGSAAKRLYWVAAGAGVWLVIASFLLRPPGITAGLVNDIVVGVIVFILSIGAARMLP